MTAEQMDKFYEPADEQPPYPLEASGWGKNTYYHHCPVHNWQTNYAVCVTLIEKAENGLRKNLGSYAKCVDCIKSGECPAVAMRQQEKEAGHALYYQPRRELKKLTEPLADKPVSSLGSVTSRKPRPSIMSIPATAAESARPAPVKPKPKVDAAPIVMDMSKIVNDLARGRVAVKEAAESLNKFADSMSNIEIASAESCPDKKVTNELTVQVEPVSTRIERLPGESPLQYARRKAMMEKGL